MNLLIVLIVLGWATAMYILHIKPTKKSERPACASPTWVGSLNRCAALADPRCKAGNCTGHCNEHCKLDCRLPVGKPGVLRSVK